MTVLDFYTIDLTTIVIILLFALVVYMFLNYIDEEKDNNFIFNITVSIFSGIIISVLYSYITIESDDLLTTNYWE